MKKLNVLDRLLFTTNILLALSTLLAYTAPYISPHLFWPVAFLGLGLPFLLLLNLLFLVYWIAKGKRTFLLSMIILILAYKSVPNFVQLRLTEKSEAEQNSLKIVSFNVRVFDLYMWSNEKSTRNKIIDFLSKEDPDILCLQEFYHQDKNIRNFDFKTLDTLIQVLSAKNYHVHYTTTLRNNDHWGIITFSKYPIVNKGVVPFQYKDDNICIYTDIQKENSTLRIYNTHLASIKLNKHDYKAMQEINKNEYSSDFEKELTLLKKIRLGFIRRAGQADSIRKSITESPHPVIVCGDFNDTPSSYAYQTIKGNLKDAFVNKGSGMGRTYVGEFPSFRIDYILYDPSLKALSFKTHSEKLSDHHPISAELAIQ